MTLKQAQIMLSAAGISLKKSYGDEYRVNPKGGTEATAYYTDDLRDAVTTGLYMAKAKRYKSNPSKYRYRVTDRRFTSRASATVYAQKLADRTNKPVKVYRSK